MTPGAVGFIVILDIIFSYELSKRLIKKNWYKKILIPLNVRPVEHNKKGIIEWVKLSYGKRVSDYQQAGCTLSEARWRTHFFIVLTFLGPIAGLRRGAFAGAFALMLVELVRRRNLHRRRRIFEARFNQNLYKIYRFLFTQLSAGLSPVEVLRHIHLAARDREMYAAMTAFSGAYFRTLNFERASKELLGRYPNKESEVLLTVLRQGIESGDSLDLIQRQEEVMTQRYLDAVALESERLQLNLILMIVASGGIVFAIMGIPLVVQMVKALESLFM